MHKTQLNGALYRAFARRLYLPLFCFKRRAIRRDDVTHTPYIVWFSPPPELLVLLRGQCLLCCVVVFFVNFAVTS